ncbi:MAG: hypothetical protein OQJ98_00950 [Candidatus Pacebacteria bacterium]|nr:hypothetical protein [Candidatus Paceibacterota bacterium]
MQNTQNDLFFTETRMLRIRWWLPVALAAYLAICTFYSTLAFWSLTMGDTNIEYWAPLHWPLKLVFG